MWKIEPAQETDLEAVVALIAEAGLPGGGLRDQFPGAYAVSREHGSLSGVAGLERYGASGLLRSVAVRPSHRRGGLGRALVAERLAAAPERGLDAVYLLTTTAPDFFRRLGFTDTPRADVPALLRGAPELASICPGSAICLVKRLGRRADEA